MSHIPYAAKLAGRDPLAVVTATLPRWEALFARIPESVVDEPTAPGKWSVRQIMAHLADCEIVWGWRMRAIYGEPGLTTQPFDQDTWAPVYKAYSYEDAKATFLAVRRWNIAFLGMLTPEDRQKPTIHPERGPEVLWTIAEIMAGHDVHHLEPLEAMFPG